MKQVGRTGLSRDGQKVYNGLGPNAEVIVHALKSSMARAKHMTSENIDIQVCWDACG